MERENPTIEICPGITRRTVANGKAVYQMMAILAAGSRMPAHSHAAGTNRSHARGIDWPKVSTFQLNLAIADAH
jgi:hypothetical protein